jgi:hypothetical protein
MGSARRLAALTLISAVLAIPVHVAAQDTLPAREAEKDLAEYADCVVGRKAYRKPVAEFLRVVPNGADFYSASMKAADLTCLNDAAVRRRTSKLEMRLQPATFRGALYPALYRRQFGRAGPPANVRSAPPFDIASEFAGDVATLPQEYVPSRVIGDCLARNAPQDAHRMLVSRPWSAGEDAAIERLKLVLADCLTNKQTVRLNREALRAYVGEASYKLFMSVSAPSQD